MYLETYSRSSISSIKPKRPYYLTRRDSERTRGTLPDHRCSNTKRPQRIKLSRAALKLYLDIITAD